MTHPFGCHVWYKPDALADDWLSKIKLEETTYKSKLAYRIKGLPCWTYDFGAHPDPETLPDSLMTVRNSKGCWYGICQHHSIVHTAILQERIEGQYNIIDGVPLKAVSIAVTGKHFAYHHSMEIYIKNKGYFRLDVGPDPRMIIAPELVWWEWYAQPTHMGNRYFCDTTGDYIKDYYLPYNSEWAGPREEPSEPKKSYLNFSTTPSNARIWLKKH